MQMELGITLKNIHKKQIFIFNFETSMNRLLHHYGSEFNTKSAKILVPFIINLLKPKSVIDVGCGIGTWLNIFEEYDINDIKGLDGPHIKRTDLLFKEEHFSAINLETTERLSNRNFDLCVCLEVAEHISEQNAEKFIFNLTLVSDIIVFSAAVPGQTGENHLNEQPFKYWFNKFEKLNYICCDIFRDKFWNNSEIEWWYKQNMFLFIKNTVKIPVNINLYNGNEYIHPELFNWYVNTLKTRNSDHIIKQDFKSSIQKKITEWLRKP